LVRKLDRLPEGKTRPALGTFISPDTLVPDPGRVIDYNCFLYARGNPLRYGDLSRIKAILLIPVHVSAKTYNFLKGIFSGCGALGNALATAACTARRP